MGQIVVNPDASPESTSVDGNVGRTGVTEDWATIRAGAGNDSSDTQTSSASPFVKAGAASPNWQRMYRSILLFDTSSIPDDATIDSAILEVYVNSVDTTAGDLSVVPVGSTPASNTALVDADYGQTQTTKLATATALSAFSTSAYNSWTLNASGIALVSDTGITKLAIAFEEDVDNAAPTWPSGSAESAVNIDYADGSNAPKLTIEYTEPVFGGAIFF